MGNLLALIFLFALIWFIGAMIKPQKFVYWGSRSRKGGLVWLGIMLAVTIAIPRGESTPTPSVEYTILTDQAHGTIKRTVEVELPSRLTPEELKNIAREIKNKDDSFDKTFIGYYIKGESSSMYWATTHYTPDLDVIIFGATQEQFKNLKSQPLDIDGELIGTWMSNNGFTSIITAYKKGDKVYVSDRYSDGSSNTQEYSMTMQDNKIRLERPNDFGEYYLVNAQGDLEFWSKNGNFYTASKR